jgi:peptidyl-prolyl cis-trans isomerase C
MTLHCIRFLTGAAIALSFVTIAHSQNSLPINAAASVNGVIISNDMVE